MDGRHRLFRRLQRASNRNRVHLAIVVGREYCQRYPDHVAAWLFFGRAQAGAKRFEEADQSLRRGLAISPPERQYLFLVQLGHLYMLWGKYGQATQWYQEAAKHSPLDSEERLRVGENLWKSGRLAEAETALKDVLAQWNESAAEGGWLLGEVMASQGRYAESQEAFELAVDIHPQRRKYTQALKEIVAIRKLLRE